MKQKSAKNAGAKQADDRQERLKAALKANLARRKQQDKSRTALKKD